MTTQPLQQPMMVAPLSIEDKPLLTHKEGEGLVSWVQSEYQKAKTARTQIQLQWNMNLAFYRGQQHVEYMRQTRNIRTPPAPPWRVRSTTNRIRPLIRTELSRVISQKPNASIVPASSEEEDLFAAQAGEQVWESLYNRKKIHAVFTRSAWWSLLTGTGFIKTYWDSAYFDKDSQQQGDICYTPVTPYHLFIPDLREEELENQPFVINAFTRPVEWIKHYWGGKLDPTKDINPSVVSANEIIEDVHLGMAGATTNSEPDSCLVYEVWLKPGGSKMFPEGGLVTVVDNQILQLQKDGIPYKHGEYPFAKIEHIPTGRFYAESSITDVIPLQREFNRTRSQIIESKNRMAKLQLLAPKGSIDPQKVTTQTGQTILYNPGFAPPQPMPLQPLPTYVLQDLQQILLDIEDITGQHQVSKGSAPPGVTAATAISFLQEKDDAYMTTTYHSVEASWEKIARQSLALAVQYWDGPRKIKTVGMDAAFDAVLLESSDIKNATDIRVEGGSALPVSKAARQALIMDFMKFGWIPPEKGLEILEIGGVQKLFDQLKQDQRQAQRENLKFKRLQTQQIQEHYQMFEQAAQQQAPVTTAEETQEPLMPPPIISPNTWDNHAVHIEVHNTFRKSQGFELLDPAIKIELEAHVKLHEQAMLPDLMAMMQGEQSSESNGPGGEQSGGNQFSGVEGMG